MFVEQRPQGGQQQSFSTVGKGDVGTVFLDRAFMLKVMQVGRRREEESRGRGPRAGVWGGSGGDEM